MYLEARELITAEWLTDRKGEKYIWISSEPSEYRAAQFLFSHMLHRQIYMDGFVSDAPSLIGLKLYHKAIRDINDLNRDNAVVLYDPFMGRYQKRDIADTGVYARRLHPAVGKENVVIWGAGVTGEQAWKILAENGIHVLYFVDSDKKLAGTVKCGLPVYMPDKLDKNITVVEALEHWKQVDESIGEKYEKRFYFSLKKPMLRSDCNADGKSKTIIDLADFWKFHLFEDKNVYIFGYGEVEKRFAYVLSLLDYSFAGFLIDETNNGNEENRDGYPVRYVEEILYESNFYIWMYGRDKAYKLEKLGLKQWTDYICQVEYEGISRGRKMCLDINLGHNYYLEESRYPGIVVYGNEGEGNYRIAVLGGSTTDGALYPFKAWPELLYEDLQCDNVTIYNGGVCGYTSGQELIRMVRDILPLQPDMIIVFDGYNDMAECDPDYPFAFPYVQQVFHYARNYVEDPNTGEACDSVCPGCVRGQGDRVTNWLSNIRSMYAIASERRIKFYSFCQPMLASKQGKNVKEKNILLSRRYTGLWYERIETFREMISAMKPLPDYMHDLSHILDDTEDAYMDYVHVWEKGNRIIAREIGDIIMPEIELAMGDKLVNGK